MSLNPVVPVRTLKQNYREGPSGEIDLRKGFTLTATAMLEYEQDLFTLSDLLGLQLDCLKLTIRISHIAHPALRRRASKDFVRMLRLPWSYKSVPPQIRKRPSRSQEIAELLRQLPSSQQ